MVVLEKDIKLDFSDVLIKPKRTTLKSRSEVSLKRTFTTLHSKINWTGVPIMVANMDTIATFEMLVETAKHNIITPIHKHYSVDEWKQWYDSSNFTKDEFQYVAVSSGISKSDYEKTKSILEHCKDIFIIVLDVANGYMESFVECIRKYRQQFPDKMIIAGNVCTSEMTEALLLAGADGVKCGIGPGSCCTTRKQTGVGMPQLSVILECADAAHGIGGLMISDGGIQVPGDFAKAFGAGADFVMAGGIFSGTDESTGDLIEKDGHKYKQFYGMSSKEAMKKYAGGVAEYRSSEGKCVEVKYKGKVENVILDFLGGIRSACSYVNAHQLEELSSKTTFVRVNNQINNIFGK